MTNSNGENAVPIDAAQDATMFPNPHSWGNEIAGFDPEKELLGMDTFANVVTGGLTIPREANQQNGATFMRMAGVFGPWGCGKTHVLNQLGPLLAKEGHRVCVFRAWEYEIEGDLASAFIRALSSEECYPWNRSTGKENEFIPDWNAVYDLGRDLGMLVLELAIAALPGKGGEIIGRVIEKLFKARDAEKDHLPPKPMVTQIRDQLNELVTNVLPPDDPKCRLYVLIDDLDRCAPPNTVRILEWFKNHFANDRTTYVMFLDDAAAAHAVQGHYKDYTGNKEDDLAFGYRYLEKIFERHWRMPSGNELIALGAHHSGLDSIPSNQWFQGILSRTNYSMPSDKRLAVLMENPLMQNPRSIIRGFTQFKNIVVSSKSVVPKIRFATIEDFYEISLALLILCLFESALNQETFKTFRTKLLGRSRISNRPPFTHDEQELFSYLADIMQNDTILNREFSEENLLRNYEIIRSGA